MMRSAPIRPELTCQATRSEHVMRREQAAAHGDQRSTPPGPNGVPAPVRK
jgi:hypothetical protein